MKISLLCVMIFSLFCLCSCKVQYRVLYNGKQYKIEIKQGVWMWEHYIEYPTAFTSKKLYYSRDSVMTKIKALRLAEIERRQEAEFEKNWKVLDL